MSEKSHSFEATLTWQPMGKKFTFKEYSRIYKVSSPGKMEFLATAAPEYAGSKYHYNPEDLLVVSLSACHMLTYLAYASNSKVEILDYVDHAKGSLHQEGKVMKFKEVILKPRIVVRKGTDLKKAESLHEKAHHGCFIANSVNFPVKIEPVFEEIEDVSTTAPV